MSAIDFPISANIGEVYTANTKTWQYTGYAWKAVTVSGSIVSSASSNVIIYSATDGQNTFTIPTYTQGANQLSVFINGVRQYPTDFNETTNTSITLTSGASANDNVMIQISQSASVVGATTVQFGYPTIIDDNTTNATKYPLFGQATSGSLTIVNTASADFSFNPSTNILNVPTLQFSDGTTISTSFASAGFYANAAFLQANAAYTRANNSINANTGGTITGNTTIIGNVFVSNTTNSISNNTGALTVSGGVGVQGNVYIDGSFYSNNQIMPTLTTVLAYQLAF